MQRRSSPSYLIISTLSVVVLIGGFTTLSYAQVPASQTRPENVVYFPVSPVELTDRGTLLERLKAYLASDPRYRGQSRADLIVVFVDDSGRPISPDAARANRALAAPSSGGAENNLTFTFDSPDYPWTADDVAFLSKALNDFYPLAKRIYGPPAFDITVNVRKDPTISFSGFYFTSSNEMIVRGASTSMLDVLCHEMLHAFRDDYLIGLASFEEGMARAGEVEIFTRLPGYTHPFDEAHGYEYDVYYEALNRPEIGATAGNIVNDGYVAFLLRYQLAGYAWGKALIENDRFLARFNRLYYKRVAADPSTQFSEASLVNIAAAASQPRVEGESFRTWYARQYVLNTTPPVGFALYHRINQYVIDFFERQPSGFVSMIPNTMVSWRMNDYNGVLLDAGADLTAANGHLSYFPVIPDGFSGRLEVIASSVTPGGQPVESVTFRPFLPGPIGEAGIFGVVLGYNEGELVLSSLDHPRMRITVQVTNGAFTAPTLETVRGRFVGFFYSGGVLRKERVFTKDASRYFVQF